MYLQLMIKQTVYVVKNICIKSRKFEFEWLKTFTLNFYLLLLDNILFYIIFR